MLLTIVTEFFHAAEQMSKGVTFMGRRCMLTLLSEANKNDLYFYTDKVWI